MEHNHLTIKTFMAIMAERDAAIRERNMALVERKRALAERDMAMMQQEAALAELNSAVHVRDKAIAALRFQGSLMADNNMTPDLLGNGTLRGAKRDHDDQQMLHVFDLVEAKGSQGKILTSNALQNTAVSSETAKPKKVRQTKETKTSKSPKVGKKGADGLSKPITTITLNCDENLLDRQLVACKNNLGLKQVNFDESAMPVPVCSCTGESQPCYKWGNGGWQSACCTTTMSVYPLPHVPNKLYSRVAGRKMSGNVFTKLLSRLADEGHDLSTPLDLKDHWAKHGSNRYSTHK